MKLLDKKLANISLQTERKQQIDQGVKIAEKVDAVRDTLAKEEKRLSEFRTLSVAHVQLEIDQKLREKSNIERDILVRKEELGKLREPLDTAWLEVKKATQDLTTVKDALYQKQANLDNGLRLNLQRERMNEEETQRIQTLKEATQHDKRMAQEARDDAVREVLNARAKATKILSDAKEREEAVEVREESTQTKEEWIKQQEAKLAKRDKEQNDRDREIKDRYETLLRTEQRIYDK